MGATIMAGLPPPPSAPLGEPVADIGAGRARGRGHDRRASR